MLLPTAAAGQAVTGDSAPGLQPAPLLLSPGVPVGSCRSCSLGAATWKPLNQAPYGSGAGGLPPQNTFLSSPLHPTGGDACGGLRWVLPRLLPASPSPGRCGFAKPPTTASALQLRFFKRKICGSTRVAEPECRRFCFSKAPALLQVRPG